MESGKEEEEDEEDEEEEEEEEEVELHSEAILIKMKSPGERQRCSHRGGRRKRIVLL